MSDSTSAASGQSLHLPNLPSNSLSFSEVKKKSSHGPKVRYSLAKKKLGHASSNNLTGARPISQEITRSKQYF